MARAEDLRRPLLKRSAFVCGSRIARLRFFATLHREKSRLSRANIGVIYDSLAIVEYLAEQYPDAELWPKDAQARAAARSISAEMHAGFQALRNDMPMDLISSLPMTAPSDVLRANIGRVVAIWCDTRDCFGRGGPFLLGAFTNADAMYAPVATRFRTYGVKLEDCGDDGTAAAYVEAIYAMPEMAEWLASAEAEMRERERV